MSKIEKDQITTGKTLRLLDELIMNEREKCLKIARRLYPGLTPDDIMNSFDYPELHFNPEYLWHDGIAAGLETAHAAICAEFQQLDADYSVKRYKTDPMAHDPDARGEAPKEQE